MTGNLLANETSPYLLQHKDNPVHWRAWGPEALAEAERDNKLILVSVGYAACHWCHVMAHESFEDAETAGLMNQLYVSVKIDREERPDIDAWLQKILQVLGKRGGWPLTAFLTPKGEPFWAGTYFPKEEAYGQPAFKAVLRDVAQRYHDAPEAVQPNIRKIGDMLDAAWYQNRAGGFDVPRLDRVAMAIAQHCDIFYGGITGAPKFPNVPVTELLWRAYLRTGMPQYMQLTLTTLDNMGRGGIYDQLGGGFARYSVDERWMVPHFEKMLYDNAQMIDINTLVWQHGRQPIIRQRIEETINWTLREMLVEGAGFASSLDADTEGEEGLFYTWTDTEIDAALAGTDTKKFKDAYGVTSEGNFRERGMPTGRNVLQRQLLAELSPAEEAVLADQRQRLFEARAVRVHPGRDDKVLTDWNGLMIAAIANAGAVFENPHWVDAARTAFHFVCEKLGDGDRLLHTYRAGKRQVQGFSDDYANMARAALTLWEVTGERDFFERARAWTRVLDEDYWDVVQGGYVYSQNPDVPANVRTRTALDTHAPSANGTMVGVHGRLFYATADQAFGDRANTLIQAFAGDVPDHYMEMATFLNTFEFCSSCLEVVIFGPKGDPRTEELRNAVLGRSVPNRLLMVIEPGETLPAGHPAEGKMMVDGQPAAYICGGRVCSPPVTSAVILSQALQLPQGLGTPGPKTADL